MYMNKISQSKWQRKPKPTSSALLEKLPGEIRNLIFQFCISNSLRGKTSRIKSKASNAFIIHVQPKWQGRSKMCLDGLGRLPLLFTNKQIYNELSTLIYSSACQVFIGGYILQHPDEDPSFRWSCAFLRLEEHPIIQKFTRSVKITLPHIRNDLFRGQWISMHFKDPQREHWSNEWAMIPELVAFLKKYECLETLEIVIVAVQAQTPNFEILLPLYDVCGKATKVEFQQPYPSGDNVFFSAGWMRNWKSTWDECLLANGRN